MKRSLFLILALCPALRADEWVLPEAPAAVEGVAVQSQEEKTLQAAGLKPAETEAALSAMALIQRRYIKKVDKEQLLRGAFDGALFDKVPGSKYHSAMKGMADQLDRFSFFMTPQEYLDYKEAKGGMSASYGLSTDLKKANENLEVLEVYPGGAAENAGIRSGDEIIELEGLAVAPMSPEELDAALPRDGRALRLTLQRPGGAVFAVVLARKKMKFNDVYWGMIAPSVGYVQISEFDDGLGANLKKALAQLRSAGMTQLLIDLRGNPGGAHSQVVAAAGLFLSRGKTIMQYVGTEDNRRYADRSQDGSLERLPIAVLVDEHSASASEIFAAAMQDNRRALIIGDRTYGKGVGQDTLELGDGSALHLTSAQWFTPNGRNVDGTGIEPDIKVRLTDAESKAAFRRLYRQMAGLKTDGQIDPVIKAALR